MTGDPFDRGTVVVAPLWVEAREWWAVPVPQRDVEVTREQPDVPEEIVQRWFAAAAEFRDACLALAEAGGWDVATGLGWEDDCAPKEPSAD